MIRLTALGYLSFFAPDLVLATVRHVQGLPPVLARRAANQIAEPATTTLYKRLNEYESVVAFVQPHRRFPAM